MEMPKVNILLDRRKAYDPHTCRLRAFVANTVHAVTWCGQADLAEGFNISLQAAKANLVLCQGPAHLPFRTPHDRRAAGELLVGAAGTAFESCHDLLLLL